MASGTNNPQKPTLAVVGTGLAGLTSDYLAKEKFDVTIYGSQSRAGMDAYTAKYLSNGIERRIDIQLQIFECLPRMRTSVRHNRADR